MQVYAYEFTVEQKGKLVLQDLPFDIGAKIQVILIPTTTQAATQTQYPFWGKPVTYLNPTEPVAEEDWEVFQ